MSADLYCVPPQMLAEFWPHVRPLLTAAVEHTDLTDPADLERDALAGCYLLWLAWSGKEVGAAWLTQILTIGSRRVLHFAAAGGNFEACKHLYEKFEAYARDEHCSSIRIVGREGWQRVLPGYHITNVIMEKSL